ncbi:MAG: MBL fold metallo-hydrolase [Limimaricola sp.]|uniref:MBL fold metallo-hydrolase RNA specificity domain-containing protein n=1 Tax=Limimaricola sp. TaxID=2211665 RepID=UPI001D9DB0E9|nr:MBL fold metallo-hydrolase [Limimaricola sp.]MBI1416013.1 MBL fold metallo-hydrolase [Limimaricola sp.]
MQLSFHGADRGVTGSCHLLQAGGLRILVDCGLFQGSHDAEIENAGPFGFDPAEIDVLLLTHAHLDHCGRIPLLVSRGFRGEIVATAATRELARLVMLDSAHLQEEEAERHSRPLRRRGRKARAPLYGIADALAALDRFGRSADYGRPLDLGPGVQVTFIDASHILGSAALVLDVTEGGLSRRIVFSGDIGNRGHPVLPDPTPPPEADYVVIETTYGDRRHRDFDASVDELVTAVQDALKRGGNAVIPTFAMERAQEVLFVLARAVQQGKLPGTMPVFLDSPMAISATDIFAHYPQAFRPEFARLLRKGHDPFGLPALAFTRDRTHSMEINSIHGGAVIMAGSGMCTGGRVLHHLRHNLWRRDSSVVFVGFAAPGTLARRIVDGAKSVRLFGETIAVKAHVHTINGFSAHADQPELLDWHAHTGQPRKTFLVHGDPDRGMAGMQVALTERGHATQCPALGEVVTLD